MMKQLLAFKNAYLNSEDGATAIEYGLIAAAVAVALTGAGTVFSDEIAETFGFIGDELESARTDGGGGGGGG